MSRYMYADNKYKTVSDVESAVRNMKDDLDNKPTTWCVVKPMINPRTISLSTGDVVGWDSGDPLTDTQIKNLDSSDKVYNVYSIHAGDNFTAISEADAVTKVNEMRTVYARWKEVSKYYDLQVSEDGPATIHNVTNEDMSGYV